MKSFVLAKVSPENRNFIKTKYTSRYYEAYNLLIRSIIINFTFAINILYSAVFCILVE